MSDESLQLVLQTPEQGHAAIAAQGWPWAKAQLQQGKPVVMEMKLLEDELTERQRRYYWGVVLRDIADHVVVGGQRYTKDAWHEYGKREFLPRVTKKTKVAGRRRPVVVTVIASTTDLSIRQMGQYLEKWMAFAAEHGVTVSEPLPPELRGKRRRDRAPVDQETGEVMVTA